MPNAHTVLAHNAPALPHDAPAVAPAILEPEPALPLRSDTILGVCEALGQDFGFNPNYLRVALASLVLWNSFAAVGIYLGLGVAVAVSRWFYPRPSAAAAPQPAEQYHAPTADNQSDEALLAA